MALRDSTRRVDRGIVWILAGAALVRLWGIDFGLPSALEARPDERTVVHKAVEFVQGDLNPRDFRYPSFFLYLLYGAYSLSAWAYSLCHPAAPGGLLVSLWSQGATSLHLIARAIAVAFGVGTVYVWWQAVRQAFGPSAARLSAILLAFAYLHVRESHFGVTDVPMVFFIAAAHWPLMCIVRSGSRGAYVCAGLLSGLAISTKYTAAPLCLVVLFAHAAHQGWRRVHVGFGRVIAAWALAALAFCCTTPYAVLDFGAFWSDVSDEIFVHGRTGHFVNPAPGWIHHARVSLRYGLGLPFCLAAVVGMAASLRPRNNCAWVMLVFPLACYLGMAFRFTVFVRYALPLTPFFALWAAMLCLAARGRCGRSWALALLWVVLTPSLARALWFDAFVSRTDTRCLAAKWLYGKLAPGETVGWTGSRWTVPVLRTEDTSSGETPALAKVSHITQAADLQARNPRFVVVAQYNALWHYCLMRPDVADWLRLHYEPVARWDPQGAERLHNVWDVQDAFFAPFARFRGVTRPGPALTVFRRSALP